MKTNIRIFCGSLIATCVLASAASATTLIGVQMAGRDNGGNSPASALGTGPTAGVIPQNNWNTSPVNSGTTPTLNDSTGAATPATLTINANDSWNSGSGTGTANNTLLNGITKVNDGGNGGGTATFTFNNLPGRYWELIAYTMENGGGANANFSATGSSTTFYTTEQTNPQGSFVQASNTINNNANRDTGNYIRFPFLDIGAGPLVFTMLHTSGTDGAGIAGFQLRSQAVPEPSTMLLLASGLGALYFAGKRVRKA